MKRAFRPIAWLTIFLAMLGIFLTGGSNQVLAADAAGESGKGDGLTITWYDAKRATPKETQRAMAERDKSKIISEGKYTNWLDFNVGSDWKDPWVWAEIKGFIKMPDNNAVEQYGQYPPHPDQLPVAIRSGSKARVMLEMSGSQVLDAWNEPVPPFENDKEYEIGTMALLLYDIHLVPSETGRYQYIRLCIGKNDSLDLSKFAFSSDNAQICFCLYRPFMAFVLSSEDYVLDYFSPDSFYTEIGLTDIKDYIKVDDEKNTVAIDLYGVDASRYYYGFKSAAAGFSNFQSFTDGANDFGNKTGTLMVWAKGSPTAVELGPVTVNKPSDLKVVSQNAHQVNLAWSYPSALMSKTKEFIVYRTPDHTSTGVAASTTGNPQDLLLQVQPNTITATSSVEEIGWTNTASFVDSTVKLDEKYNYTVLAVGQDGTQSLPCSLLEVSVKDVTPPTAPGNLLAGDVLGHGNDALYAFPEDSVIRNVLLGPEREIALRWDPAGDDVGVVGYNIYRSAFGRKANDVWGEPEHLVGTTNDAFFIDSGLDFGATYTYFVEAKDAAGNISSRNIGICIGTEKSALAGLGITSGGQSLTPAPAFAYYQTEYALSVNNPVNSITLTPDKIDEQAKVRVNGIEASGAGGIGPLVLEPGENVILIEVIPRKGLQWFITPETVRYTLTVNRANLDNPPVLTLPEGGTVLNEGDTYKAAGRIDIPNDLVWTGTADYGDRSGEKPLTLNTDGSFILEHQYLDNGRYKINIYFRYQDLGLVNGSLELTVQNMAPSLNGMKDEYPTKEGSLLTIEGSISDPGPDAWTVAGECGWGPIEGKVNGDKFTLQYVFYDQQPEYDMVLKVKDDDGGESSKNIKIKVENVAPAVQAAGQAAIVLQGYPFTGTGSFTDPGREDWLATVDFGDGGGEQDLAFNKDKSFALSHTYLAAGDFTVTVRVKENKEGGEVGSASFEVKVKDYLFTLEAGADTSIQEGQELVRNVSVKGIPKKVKSITVDYGDGTGEETVAWSTLPAAQTGAVIIDKSSPVFVVQHVDSVSAEAAGWLPLKHVYKDNGIYTVKAKIVDADGDSFEDSFKVEVVNVPPTVKVESLGVLKVNKPFNCRGSITDPGADTWTVEVNFNDGSKPEIVSIDPQKTFSLKHSYGKADTYGIEVTARDDDGGVGQFTKTATVISGNGSSHRSDPNDATLHSLVGLNNLIQNDAAHGYTNDGFTPACHIYTCSGAFLATAIEVTADDGATITYSIDGGAVQALPQNVFTGFNLDVGSTLTIYVTAEDGVTTSEYTIEHI